MKKATKLKHWLFELIAKFMPDERPNLKKNEDEILNLLLYSNFNKLEISESTQIMLNVKRRFDEKVLLSESYHQKELKAIEGFKISKNERIKELVNDPNFDKQLKDINVNYEFVKPE